MVVEIGNFLPVWHPKRPKMGKLLEKSGSNWALWEV